MRILLETPGFTLTALLVFALGIGATTAIISVADAFFVRCLPVPQTERVMTLWQYNRETGATQQDVAPANAIDWMKRVQSFEAIAVAEPWTVQSSITGREPVALEAARVSEQFFTVLDAPLLHGRPFWRGNISAEANALPSSATPCGRLISAATRRSSVAACA